jgi:hypothetical protein
MAQGTAGSREAHFEALKEGESGEGDSLMKFGPVKGVSNEKREFSLRMGRGGRVFGTSEKMCDEMSWL